jgi:hypothetical protein
MLCLGSWHNGLHGSVCTFDCVHELNWHSTKIVRKHNNNTISHLIFSGTWKSSKLSWQCYIQKLFLHLWQTKKPSKYNLRVMLGPARYEGMMACYGLCLDRNKDLPHWYCMAWRASRSLVRLSLSAKSASHSAVFFSHNKSANNTFNHNLSTKWTRRDPDREWAKAHELCCVGTALHLTYPKSTQSCPCPLLP